MSTVRGMVKAIQVEAMAGDLSPERASALCVTLTALLGNVADEIRDADMVYATVLLQALDAETKANRAKIRAETTPEYRRKREARDTLMLVQELIRSLRQMLRTLSDEMKLSR